MPASINMRGRGTSTIVMEESTVATIDKAVAMATRVGADITIEHIRRADNDREQGIALYFRDRDVTVLSKQGGVRVRRMPLFTL